MKSDMRSLQDEVAAVMRESMDARHCDLTAWMMTMERYHYDSYLGITRWISGGAKTKAPKHYPGVDSVRRARQKINRHGMLLPADPKVAKARRRRQHEMHDYAVEALTPQVNGGQ